MPNKSVRKARWLNVAWLLLKFLINDDDERVVPTTTHRHSSSSLQIFNNVSVCRFERKDNGWGWIKDGKGEAQTLIFLLRDHAAVLLVHFGIQSCCRTEKDSWCCSNLGSSSNQTEFHLLSWEIIILQHTKEWSINTHLAPSIMFIVASKTNERRSDWEALEWIRRRKRWTNRSEGVF